MGTIEKKNFLFLAEKLVETFLSNYFLPGKTVRNGECSALELGRIL